MINIYDLEDELQPATDVLFVNDVESPFFKNYKLYDTMRQSIDEYYN